MQQMETLILEYKSIEDFQKDAAKLAEQGWTVQSQTERTNRSGILRCCILSIFALVFPPKPSIIVTYVRPKSQT